MASTGHGFVIFKRMKRIGVMAFGEKRGAFRSINSAGGIKAE